LHRKEITGQQAKGPRFLLAELHSIEHQIRESRGRPFHLENSHCFRLYDLCDLSVL
jgi:hypothetical protein